CSTTSVPFTFTIANHPTVNIAGSNTFCYGDSMLLTANATAGSGSISGYQWQESNTDITGATSGTNYASAVGSYTVVVTNTFGCTEISTPFNVSVLPWPVAGFTYTVIGDSVAFTNASGYGATYSWDFDDGSPF